MKGPMTMNESEGNLLEREKTDFAERIRFVS